MHKDVVMIRSAGSELVSANNTVKICNAAVQYSDIRKFTEYGTTKGAIDFGQGSCHVEPTTEKRSAVMAFAAALERGLTEPGFNSYSSYRGIPLLRKRISDKWERFNHLTVDPESEVLVTAGALAAFNCALDALTRPNDAVMLVEPFYPFHREQLRNKGLSVIAVPTCAPDWMFDRGALEKAYTPNV